MKVIKYPQACLMIETNGTKILVDPGCLKYQDKYFEAWQTADVVLATHKHADHINEGVLSKYAMPIYATEEVKKEFPELPIKVIKVADVFEFDGVKVEVVKAVHGYNPNLKNGKEVFENVGYIIDDGRIRLYAAGDTICFNHDYKADVVALPVTGHGLTMSSYEAALLTKEMGAKLLLPVHMDNEMYPTDVESMKKTFNKFNIEYQVLDIEEKIEL